MGATRFLTVPGWQGSGPDHWQSRWEREDPALVRVEMPDWDRPERAGWIAALVAAVRASPAPVVLIAHSLGCFAVAHAADQLGDVVRAALLVAPPDLERADCPPAVRDFAPMPWRRLPFRSHVVGSDNDPYTEAARFAELARAWGSALTLVPGAGHLNTDAGYGPWPGGRALLASVAPAG